MGIFSRWTRRRFMGSAAAAGLAGGLGLPRLARAGL
ncbi:MAG TPA: twin-arginine translocation signal domain-containing protein, partial [Rhodospirillales bacterium]|nr:twin-arginine translocation signal domain-containing protein [Rhodospirillales bacterium]